MVSTRIHLSRNFAMAIAESVTIAMRYSAVRFQGQNPNGYILFYRKNDLISLVDGINIGMKHEFLIIHYNKKNLYHAFRLLMHFSLPS